MKVRCLDNENGRYHLTVGKTYDVIQQGTDTYHILNDEGEANDYFTHRFEVVQDTTKRVKCVVNSGTSDLTIGKVYEVVRENDHDYLVVDDTGTQAFYVKRRFEPISDEVVEPATKEAPTLPAPPQDPPFDFDAYNGIKPLRKVHIP